LILLAAKGLLTVNRMIKIVRLKALRSTKVFLG
jgi:hypothetical protein